MSTVVGSIAELWRFPLKSTRGQRLQEVWCGARGLEGDRAWAIRGADGKLGSGKTTRRFRRMPDLLSMASFIDADGAAWVRFTDGSARRLDDPLSAALVGAVVGERVSLVQEEAVSHFDDAPLHLMTAASLRWLAGHRPDDQVDARRFRPNLVVDNQGCELSEDRWVGSRLEMGEVVVTVEKRTERCVMPTLAQEELGYAPGLLKFLGAANDTSLGVYGRVEVEGRVRVGDPVALFPYG